MFFFILATSIIANPRDPPQNIGKLESDKLNNKSILSISFSCPLDRTLFVGSSLLDKHLGTPYSLTVMLIGGKCAAILLCCFP